MKWVVMDYQNGNRNIMGDEQYEKEVGSLSEHDEAVKGIVEFPVQPTWDMLAVDPETREYVLRDFGTVKHDGKTLYLTEQAYMDNYKADGAVRYYAHAVDKNGNEYRVAWDTTEEYNLANELFRLDEEAKLLKQHGEELSEAKDERLEELRAMNLPDVSFYADDESNCCDWDKPVEVELI